MQNRAIKFLHVSALYLAVVPMGISAVFAQSLTLAPATESSAGRIANTGTGIVDPNAPKLIYHATGTDLTVGDLSSVQRTKLEADFFKRAGFTDVQPVNSKPLRSSIVAVSKPINSLAIVGVYGPVNSQKVDFSYNGELHTLTANSRFQNVLIESIKPGKVVVVYTYRKAATTKSKKLNKAAREIRQTLKPGDMLEIPA